jgi:Holliday junction DNA helicase RuvA
MIGRLRGVLAHKAPPALLIDVGGVGYDVEAPMSTVYELPEVGQDVVLLTHLAIKEDAHALYGFLTEAERHLFRALLKISGIGAKTALNVLSGVSVDNFSRLIQASDVTALTRIPGIGKKTAERIVIELRDKASDLASGLAGSGGFSVRGAVPADPVAEASSALTALGYKAVEVSKLVKDVAEPGMDAETIIRRALSAALKIKG